jgi:predicted PolB exonuclease-like 3'-5' exonuclease
MDIKRIAFFDIETAGCAEKLSDLSKRMETLWTEWQEKLDRDPVQEFIDKSALHAEYAKTICVSFGYYDKNMEKKIQSFYGDNEKEILEKTASVLNNSDRAGFHLAGHNIERFDIPFLWKRMLANGVTPPTIISVWDKKPWDLKFFDLAKVWSDGSWKESFTSLDTLSAVMGIASPKTVLHGRDVHRAFYDGRIEEIKTYCESDVAATMEIADKLLKIMQGTPKSQMAVV